MTHFAPDCEARGATDAVVTGYRLSVPHLVLCMLQSERERARPLQTRLPLIATVFGRASNVLMVALAASICGSAAAVRTGDWLPAAIAAVEVVLLLTRCGVILAFQRRHRCGAMADPDLWLVRFGLLAIASSVAWGSLCFVCLAYAHDPVLYVLPVLSTVGTAGAIAARNSGVPRLAKLQLSASLLPIIAGCVFADDHGYRLLVPLVSAMAAGLLILIAERNHQLVELIETQAELARLSQTDPLTQLSNRRFLDARLQSAIAAAEAAHRSSALLMIDVDAFKAFNDRHGHPAGDALLRHVAGLLKQQVRSEHDVVARYGGEEFAILLEGAEAGEALAVGERLRQAVQADDVVTVSIGIAVIASATDADRVMRDVDDALYRAKGAGRNRIELAPQGSHNACKAAA